jgi:high-affinity iron transporter
VGREGLETVVFTLAIVFSTSTAGALAGGGVGLAAAMVVAFAVYRLGKRIDIGLFFKVVGALLMVFAAGLLVDTVDNMQKLGWLPVVAHPLWNSAHVLSEDSAMGDVVHSFFGYVSRPTLLEVGVWVLYIAVTVTAFLGLWSRLLRHQPATIEARPSSHP